MFQLTVMFYWLNHVVMARLRVSWNNFSLGPSSASNGHDTLGAAGKDDSFREFRRLCADIAEENSYTGKTAIVKKFITKGISGGIIIIQNSKA